MPVQKIWDNLLNIINLAAEKAISKFKVPKFNNVGFTSKKWWNEQCSKAVAERRLALTKFKQYKCSQQCSKITKELR